MIELEITRAVLNPLNCYFFVVSVSLEVLIRFVDCGCIVELQKNLVGDAEAHKEELGACQGKTAVIGLTYRVFDEKDVLDLPVEVSHRVSDVWSEHSCTLENSREGSCHPAGEPTLPQAC